MGRRAIEMDERDNMAKSFTDENGISFVDIKVVGDFYGVSKETVLHWIKDGKISGKQLAGHGRKWFVPAEEFEYLKKRREGDAMEDLEEHMKETLGKDYDVTWEFELDDE